MVKIIWKMGENRENAIEFKMEMNVQNKVQKSPIRSSHDQNDDDGDEKKTHSKMSHGIYKRITEPISLNA